MKRAWLTLAILVIAALNWAALHDILRRREPDVRMEYTVVILTGLGLLAWVAVRLLRTRRGETPR